MAVTDLFQSSELQADVAVPLPIVGLFSYRLPAELKEKAKPGVRVQVSFKNRSLMGYVVSVQPVNPDQKLKSISAILDDHPVISENMLELTHWISSYYGCSWGEAIENALPKWVKFGKKAERALKKDDPKPSTDLLPSKEPLELTEDQLAAFQHILEALDQPHPKPALLFGVTGSGKSEVYIRAIRAVIGRGQSAICLVPEIALTEQLRRFFIQHFGDLLEIVHSKLNDTERFLAWKRLERGEKRVVLGPRSAVFAPVPKLGLMIIDEEHENTYKQETSPRYHARDVAMWRANKEGALLLLGSATPSLETMSRAETGEIIRLDLNSRIDQRAMPAVEILDLKTAQPSQRRSTILSLRLAMEIEKNLKMKKGTLLLLNRRGFSTHIHCPHCGQVENCISCHVSMTFHHEDSNLLCHYCNYSKPVSQECLQCGSKLLKFAGFGTEKVESEVAARFPEAKISRMDADSVKKKGSHESILRDFRDQKIDILIGTQMIAKGFDFPHVTLVGVILADVGLMLPDFRSSERTFQLLTQVAGRAGRGKDPGRVIIQTFSPDHPSVLHAKTHDYRTFYREELTQRKEFRYPPYYRLANIIIRSKDESKAYQFGRVLRTELEIQSKQNASPALPVEIIGPAPLPFYKLRGHFRWHLMIKTAATDFAGDWIYESLRQVKKPAQVAFAVDMDPLSIL